MGSGQTYVLLDCRQTLTLTLWRAEDQPVRSSEKSRRPSLFWRREDQRRRTGNDPAGVLLTSKTIQTIFVVTEPLVVMLSPAHQLRPHQIDPCDRSKRIPFRVNVQRGSTSSGNSLMTETSRRSPFLSLSLVSPPTLSSVSSLLLLQLTFLTSPPLKLSSPSILTYLMISERPWIIITPFHVMWGTHGTGRRRALAVVHIKNGTRPVRGCW